MARPSGFGVEVEGLEELIRGSSNGYKLLRGVMRDVLRGPVGDDILRELRARLSDHTRSGSTLRQLRRGDDGSDGVKIGVFGDRQFVATFLESGTKPHIINPGARNKNASQYKKFRAGALNINGRWVTHVQHPGTRRHRIAQTTLRVLKNDIETAIVRGMEDRLEPKMGMR